MQLVTNAGATHLVVSLGRRGRVQAVSHNVVLALIALVFFVFSGGVLPDTRALLL